MELTWYWWLFLGTWAAMAVVLQLTTGRRGEILDSIHAAYRRLVGRGLGVSIVAGAVYSAIVTVILGFLMSVAD